MIISENLIFLFNLKENLLFEEITNPSLTMPLMFLFNKVENLLKSILLLRFEISPSKL